MNAFALVALALSAGLVTFANIHAEKSTQLLNVSYDPTRELFKDVTRQFVTKYQHDTGSSWRFSSLMVDPRASLAP